jgi:hypothetical protein
MWYNKTIILIIIHKIIKDQLLYKELERVKFNNRRVAEKEGNCLRM